jgi:hypothetical protein
MKPEQLPYDHAAFIESLNTKEGVLAYLDDIKSFTYWTMWISSFYHNLAI